MNISLIANTGIQFFTTDFEIKAEESFIDKDGNFLSPLSIKDENGYDMPLVFHESYNIMDDIWTLEMAVNFSGGQIVRLDELRNHISNLRMTIALQKSQLEKICSENQDYIQCFNNEESIKK